MPASASFLNACLAAIQSLPQYAAFQAALLTLSQASEENRLAAWKDAYDDGQPGLSPAHALRRAVRDVVVNTQASQGVTLSQPDAEAAYQTLAAQVAPDSQPPVTFAERTPSFSQEDIDTIRLAAARLAAD